MCKDFFLDAQGFVLAMVRLFCPAAAKSRRERATQHRLKSKLFMYPSYHKQIAIKLSPKNP